MASRGTMINSFDPSTADRLAPKLRSSVGRRRSLLGPAYKLFYEVPLEVVRGEGIHLFDADGNAYLDAYNNVPCVGHCHPRVVDAVARQAAILNTNTRYLSDMILDYTERLLATHHDGLGNVMFTCTGSEANDLALRIARYATGAEGVIVTANAYHGLTAAVAEASPSLGDKVPLGQSVRTVPAPPPATDDDPGQVGERMAATVAEAVADLERHGMRLAGFLVDTMFSSDGLMAEPAGFLAPVADVVHRAGGLLIADEVQAGFGRTGERMWGYQRHGIAPDLVTMGKPMGNGMPIAAVAVRPELLERFGTDIRYFNTFGGNSVSIAAATAVLDVIDDEGLLEHSRDVGRLALDGLARIADRHPAMRGARGAGLYLAADLVEPETGRPDARLANRVVNELRERRVLISATGPAANTLKIRPPLPFGRDDAERLLSALEQVLDALSDVRLSSGTS